MVFTVYFSLECYPLAWFLFTYLPYHWWISSQSILYACFKRYNSDLAPQNQHVPTFGLLISLQYSSIPLSRYLSPIDQLNQAFQMNWPKIKVAINCFMYLSPHLSIWLRLHFYSGNSLHRPSMLVNLVYGETPSLNVSYCAYLVQSDELIIIDKGRIEGAFSPL
jgi:hypothetical protein